MSTEKLPLTQPRQEVIDGISKISSVRTETKIPQAAAWAMLNSPFIKIAAVLIIAGILIASFLLKNAAMLKDSYQKGLNDGMASVNTSLTLAQQSLKGQNEQISQLQSDLGNSNHNV